MASTAQRMARLPEHAIIMHPGPMNRGLEISAEAADSPRSVIVEQVANGVAVRMAALYLLLAGEEQAVSNAFVITGASVYGEKVGRRRGASTASSSPSRTRPQAPRASTPTGLVLLPGLVDLHTHLREPGREDAETIETGSRAAARGGWTADSRDGEHHPGGRHGRRGGAGVVAGDARSGWWTCIPVGAVTVGLKGEHLSEMGAMAHSRARVRLFSDDGICVYDPVIMRRALEYVKSFDGAVVQHAQDLRLTEGSQMHEGEVSAELGLTGWPAVAEESIVARDVLLAGHVGSRVHIQHLSTAGSVDIVRWAKSRGIQVTAEATPHHLLPHPRRGAQLQPAVQGQSAAAHRRGRRRGARRAWRTARSTSSRPITRPTRARTRTASGPRPRLA